MAVAAPARRTAPAPRPSRTTPPRRPARAVPPPRKAAAPAPVRRPSSRPQRAQPKKRAVRGQLIPLAGRTAVAVGQIPDSSLVVQMTRGRLWIGVLGVLLAGIVTLNVITLSFAASAGKIDEQITTLRQEISVMSSRDARLSGIGPVRQAAAPLGLTMPSSDQIHFTDAGPDDVATAAQRLAAASPG